MTERLMRALAAPRMGAKAEALFVKRLSMLLASGMDLPSALRSLSAGTGARMSEAIESIAQDVEAGQRVSASIARYPRLFSPLARELVSVGEASGTLAGSLAHLSHELQRRDRLWGKLLGALLYPALLAGLTLLVTGCLIAFVFPRIIPLFSGLGTDMPLPTRMLLSIHAFAANWWLWVLAALAAAIALSVHLRRKEAVRRSQAHLLMRMPVLGAMLASYQVALVSRSLGILLESGVPLPDALAGAASASNAILYRDALLEARSRVEQGSGIRESLSPYPHLFPGLAGDLLSAGEMGGGLSESAFHLADYYEHEFEEASRRLTVLAEPVLMVLMGLIVGFVAIAMILPIYAITDGLSAR